MVIAALTMAIAGAKKARGTLYMQVAAMRPTTASLRARPAHRKQQTHGVIPANAGIHNHKRCDIETWSARPPVYGFPAFAGMTSDLFGRC